MYEFSKRHGYYVERMDYRNYVLVDADGEEHERFYFDPKDDWANA